MSHNAHEYVNLWNRFEKQLTDSELEGVLKISNPIIERGKNLIYPQRTEQWEACVKTRMCSIYNGSEVLSAISAMELIDKKASFETITDTLLQYPHTPFSLTVALNIITAFSKNGPEYAEKLASVLPDFHLNEKFLNEIKSQNAQFEQELTVKSMC